MREDPLAALEVLSPREDAPTWSALSDVWQAYRSERAAGRAPFVAAVRVAARADRLGHAFAVGYPAALEHLAPNVGFPCALCATEADGNSPRAIETTLTPVEEGYRLDGVKTFVTFGTLAKTLIVVARAGDKPDGRPNLVVVRVPSDRRGVNVAELPPMPFVPEITHARLELSGVRVHKKERLPGDGYLGYLKPFRTIEDIHVIGAALGYVIGWANRVGAQAELIASLSSDLVVLDTLRLSEPLDPRVHVVLHGCYQSVIGTLRNEDFARMLDAASEAERDRWHRDRQLLSVASKARRARFSAARESLGMRDSGAGD